MKTNWEEYRNEIELQLNLNASLKNPTEIEPKFDRNAHPSSCTSELQQSQQNYTPIPAEIKKLVAVKRRARAKWQGTHAPQDKTALNRATHQLRARLKEKRDKSFHDYVTGLT